MEGIGLTGDNKVFTNHFFCLYYRALWSKLKVLLNMGKTNKLMVSNGTAKVRISENNSPISKFPCRLLHKMYWFIPKCSVWLKLSAYLFESILSFLFQCLLLLCFSVFNISLIFFLSLSWNLTPLFQFCFAFFVDDFYWSLPTNGFLCLISLLSTSFFSILTIF